MKQLLSALCLLGLASTLALAQEYPFWRPGPPPKHFRHQQPPQTPQHQRPQYVCNTEWRPVCARTRQNIVAIYSNRCFAEQDGANYVGPSEECNLLPCPANYEPVCARKYVEQTRSFIVKPYYNECAARELDKAVPLTSWAEFRQRHQNYPHFRNNGTIDISFVCPATCSGKIELVCGEDEFGKLRLYANRCQAILEGAVFKKYGVCGGR